MIEVKVDESEVRKIYLKKLDEHIKKMDKEFLFWNSKDLMKQTRLSWNTIQKEFFYDPRFPKRKVGNKWLFPAKKTKEFLLEWIEEQE
ncbi:group-specific protein [Cytobacillus sp. FSL H8-0458]|uniref:group-specific protein n=1 Tax=Cytobacillus sp. FSL H8-0458 TaxID=2975346 RepID=UPI0030F735A1